MRDWHWSLTSGMVSGPSAIWIGQAQRFRLGLRNIDDPFCHWYGEHQSSGMSSRSQNTQGGLISEDSGILPPRCCSTIAMFYFETPAGALPNHIRSWNVFDV